MATIDHYAALDTAPGYLAMWTVGEAADKAADAVPARCTRGWLKVGGGSYTAGQSFSVYRGDTVLSTGLPFSLACRVAAWNSHNQLVSVVASDGEILVDFQDTYVVEAAPHYVVWEY